MPDLLTIMFLTLFAGAGIPLGGLLASYQHIEAQWLEKEFRHFVIAFGGGVLLGAVAVVLVPEGVESMDNSLWAIPIFLAGGVAFFALEKQLGLRGRSSPQLLGMLLDYVPEAIALGGLLALGSPTAALLASLIALQNVPEGFNAYRELAARNHDSKKTLRVMSSLALLGPMCGLLGY